MMPGLDDLYPPGKPTNPYDDWFQPPACLDTPFDAIIILGCPSNDDGTSSVCQEDRVAKALVFSAEGYGDQFIVTGAAVYNESVEAESLAGLLMDSGVSEENIHLEPRAEHTDENLYYSSQIMLEQGWTTAMVISEPEHLLYSAVCDANCCVKLGWLWTFAFDIGGETEKASYYQLSPDSDPWVETCETETLPLLVMCINLSSRRACADDFQL